MKLEIVEYGNCGKWKIVEKEHCGKYKLLKMETVKNKNCWKLLKIVEKGNCGKFKLQTICQCVLLLDWPT